VNQPPCQVRTAYDTVAPEYAEKFCGELAHKPLDCELLQRFAAAVPPPGPTADLGCGPGQTTAFLHACGARVYGLDLSPALLQEARRHAEIPFLSGDMLALPFREASLAGAVAFYAIVHFDPLQLQAALHEMHRVLRPGGLLLLSFHVGDQSVAVDQFLGHSVSLTFVFFPVPQVTAALHEAGFTDIEVVERDPYPDVEFPSHRAYVFAQKP
jgi:ubiquinone/menaquinone biosynthesis C-methylase UbiE